MTEQKDLCPISDSGNHRYFIYKVVEVFESLDKDQVIQAPDNDGRQLYEKVEYAISGCNCGSAIKQKVKQK